MKGVTSTLERKLLYISFLVGWSVLEQIRACGKEHDCVPHIFLSFTFALVNACCNNCMRIMKHNCRWFIFLYVALRSGDVIQCTWKKQPLISSGNVSFARAYRQCTLSPYFTILHTKRAYCMYLNSDKSI